eukprot:gene4846-3472_t
MCIEFMCVDAESHQRCVASPPFCSYGVHMDIGKDIFFLTFISFTVTDSEQQQQKKKILSSSES